MIAFMQAGLLSHFKIIPREDPKQALRLQRFFMAFAAYIICALLAYLAYLSNIVQREAFTGWAILATTINLGIYTFLRSGLNKKMADPSLTVFQMCSAIIMVMYVMFYANQSRGVWLLLYVIILLFGIFRLNTRRFLYVSFFTLLTYGSVIAYLHLYKPQGVNFPMEYLQWTVLAGILALFSVIGGHISALRVNLGKSRSTIKQITDNMQDAIFVLDANLNYTYVSPSVKLISGYSQEAILRQTPLASLTPTSLDLVQRKLTSIREEKDGNSDDRPQMLQLEVQRKDGSTIWTETKFTYMRDENQKVEQIIGVMRDISERKEAEALQGTMLEEIQRAEEKYRSIMENIREAYFEVDLNGNFTFFNDSLCRLTMYSTFELSGANYTNISDDETAKLVYQTFNQVFNTGEPTEAFDWPVIGKDGLRRFVEASVSLRKDSAGNRIGFKGMLRDVSERKRAEEELQQARDKLAQAEKLSALGQLSIVVAHEILNPLNIISMELQVLQATEDISPEIQEDLGICMQQIDRISTIAEELKQLTSSPDKQMELTDINELIAHVLAVYKLQLRTYNVRTEVHYEQDLPKILMDHRKMEQVILNLISNARDAMEGLESKVLKISTQWGFDRDSIRIIVSDNGTGFGGQNATKLFNAFFTTKGHDKGTGLGLYISSDIIRNHGGKIWAQNNESGGASFYISLPLKRRTLGNY